MLRWPLRLLLAVLLIGAPGWAQQPVPSLTARVTDQTGTLSAQQIDALEHTLADFEARKGSQIAVLMVAGTQPESIEQYSIRVVEQWRLGRKKVDDGALLIIAKDDHQMRIEVGYGLEGALTDVICARIIREVITPRFRAGDFYGGISEGISRMIGVIDGEPLPAPESAPPSLSPGHYWALIVFGILALGQFSRSLFGRVPGALVTGGVAGLGTWLLLGIVWWGIPAAVVAFLVTLLGGSSMQVIGPGSIGRFGGGLGGGFGGGGGFHGGGGGFGGGGASGSW